MWLVIKHETDLRGFQKTRVLIQTTQESQARYRFAKSSALLHGKDRLELVHDSTIVESVKAPELGYPADGDDEQIDGVMP